MTSAERPVLLVIDDEPAVIGVVQRFAEAAGFESIARAGGRGMLDELPDIKADVALVDLRMPEIGGLDVLRAIHASDPTCQVILMTAHATVESAIEAVKLGALDFLSKPLDFDRLGDLLTTVRRDIERRRLLLAADGDVAARFEFQGMIGRSPVMQELFDRIRRLAPHMRTALVTGETGTGKELVARALHRLGPRRDRRFATANCSAIVETLFESEFFGHTRGAFTGASDAKPGLFEQADGGTLFLDEIGELPPAMQAKLLRVVEYGDVQRIGATASRKVDVHVVAATNRRLPEAIAAGTFRQDLYYRLNIVEIALPPLRERREDIPYLTAAFVREFSRRFGKPLGGLTSGAERLLHQAAWPGNVRELRNVLERACMLSDGRVLAERDIMSSLQGAQPLATAAPAADAVEPEPAVELTREKIEDVLKQVGGNRSAAARALGVSRRALYRRLDSFGLR